MVTDGERRFVYLMVKLGLFRVRIGFMRITEIVPRFGTRWILNWLKRRQVVDSFHHAPCCEANHYHKQRLVFLRCTCGADTVDTLDFGTLSLLPKLRAVIKQLESL